MRTALFRVITNRVVVISSRHLGITYRSHFQRSRIQQESRLYTVYVKKSVGGDKFSVTWWQAVWLMQVVGRMEECNSRRRFEETLSIWEEILTGAAAKHRRTSA